VVLFKTSSIKEMVCEEEVIILFGVDRMLGEDMFFKGLVAGDSNLLPIVFEDTLCPKLCIIDSSYLRLTGIGANCTFFVLGVTFFDDFFIAEGSFGASLA
jgi:hypothetical protein